MFGHGFRPNVSNIVVVFLHYDVIPKSFKNVSDPDSKKCVWLYPNLIPLGSQHSAGRQWIPPWPIMISVFIWVQQPDSGVICQGQCCLSYTDLSVEMCGVCIAVRRGLTCGFWVARPLNVLSLVAEPQGCVGRVDEIVIWVMCFLMPVEFVMGGITFINCVYSHFIDF